MTYLTFSTLEIPFNLSNSISRFLFISIFLISGFKALSQDCVQHSTAVLAATTGVTNSGNSTGAPDGMWSDVDDGTDVLALDLGETVPSGTELTFTWRRRNYGDGGTAFVDVSVSNLVAGTYNALGTISTVEETNFITSTLTTTANTRYVQLIQDDGNGDDFDFDALSFELASPQFFAESTNSSCTDGSADNNGTISITSVLNG